MTIVSAILTDIEGTTTPIAFVRDTLFPFARAALPEFVARHGADPEVASALAETARLAPDAPPLATLLAWMDQDSKATPLKALQGLIWRQGYDSGALRGELYPDVPGCLRAWRDGGLRLMVYSSGSAGAQRLIFGRSVAGDLSGLFESYFDTRVGAKRDGASYDRIAIAAEIPASEILFLSDVDAELDAAAGAGLRTCQIVRPQDGTVAGANHPVAADFREVAAMFRLPA